MPLFYDRVLNHVSETQNARGSAGTMSGFSWRHLCELIESTGNVNKDEKITDIKADDFGVTYRIEKK